MKHLSILLILALLCSFCACGKEEVTAVQEPTEPTEPTEPMPAVVPETLPSDAPVVVTENAWVSWVFSGDTLTISGEGNMEDYELFTTPWDQAGNSFSVKKLIVGEGVRYLGKYAFATCCNLQEVRLPSTLRRIGASCFADCGALETIELPEGLMVIEDNAFAGCGLTGLTLPSTLAEIGNAAFANCIALKNVSVDRALLTVGLDAFFGCADATLAVPGGCLCESFLTEQGYTLVSGTPAAGAAAEPLRWSGEGWSFENGLLTVSETRDYAASGVDSAPWGCLAPVIERIELTSAGNIGSYSFWNCKRCKSVSIPEGVASIGDYAFGACTSLESLTLPATLKSIGYGAFSFCTALTSLTLPEGLESVGPDAFVMCSGITEVNKPASLKEIGAGAFNFRGENTGELVE